LVHRLRERKPTVEKLLGLAVVGGLAVALASIGAGYAVGSGGHASAAKVSIVTVTAGEPNELSFLLSRSSDIPAGLVQFKVTDRGVAFHNFKICTSLAGTALVDSCVGKATKDLRRGQSTTLTVTLKQGMHEFLCTLSGHAAAGMKGLIGIGVALSPAEGPAVTPTLSTATAPRPTSTGTTTPTATTPATTAPGTTTLATTTTTLGTTTPNTTTPGGTTTGTTTTLGADTDASADPACPAGETIKTGGNSDDDGDELGSPSDGDGCI
jgi:hypothetical protein